MPERNDGRRGHLGLALQTLPGTYVPPTTYLRQTGGSGFLPDRIEIQSKALLGTPFELPAEFAGTDFMNRTIPAEATPADAALILRSMFGTPNGSGIITPDPNTQWGDNFPMQPLSGQWFVPGAGYVQFRDAQVGELTLTVPESRTDLVGMSISLSAAWAERHPVGAPRNGFVPAVPGNMPLTTGGVFRRNDHTATIGGTSYCPSGTSTVRFYNPVEGLPACGLTIPGFAPGTEPVGVEFQMAFNRPMEFVMAASESKAFIPYVWRLERGGSVIQVTANVQVSATEVPVGAGRVVTTATFRARAQSTLDVPFTLQTLVV